MIKFTVKGNPVPKPRMTKRDVWRERPCVIKYRKYATNVQKEYVKACGDRIIKHDEPVYMSFHFYVVGSLNRFDLDNCIKGIIDALIKIGMTEDDTMQYIRGFRDTYAISVCLICPYYKKKYKTCYEYKHFRECPRSYTEIKIDRWSY